MPQIPPAPTRDTTPEADIPYYEYLADTKKSISIREFLGYWGYTVRGVNINNRINAAMERIGFQTLPPIDTGSLDSQIIIYKTEEENEGDTVARQRLAELADNNHLLTLAVIPSATLNQLEEPSLTVVHTEESIHTALTKMLQHDYSQLPVIDKNSPDIIQGVFSWESYAHTTLSGRTPKLVGDAMLNPRIVELRTDLFQSTSSIAQDGFVLVTHLGKLSGIVTAADLTKQFESLAIPFLAVGRAEQELKRVAKLLIGENQITKKDKEIPVDGMTLGHLEDYYMQHWNDLKWALDIEQFKAWFDAVRKLRNNIAHFNDQDEDISDEIEQANRLTIWLQQFKNKPKE